MTVVRRKQVEMKQRGFVFLSIATAAVALSGCGAGTYGFSRYYTPTDEEEPFHETSREFTYGAVTARPRDFRDQSVSWFGVVQSVKQTADGRQTIRLAYHKHKERHLCEGETESTCRVTIHHKSTGGFTAVVRLRSQDQSSGLEKVRPGTLMRVFGKVRCKKDVNGDPVCARDDEGGVILDCEYYRQWPVRYYRTTRSAGKMVR